VTSPAAGDGVLAWQAFTPAAANIVTAWSWWRLPVVAVAQYTLLELRTVTGGNDYASYLLWTPAGNKLQYGNSAGGSTDVPGGGFTPANNTWYRFGVQIAVSTQKYVQVYLGATAYSLAGIALRNDGALAPARGRIAAKVVAIGAAAATLHVDDLLVTEQP
jgi:hypothetical protein